MKRSLLFFFLAALSTHSLAQRSDKTLLHRVQNLLQGFHGKAGIYIKDLKKGRTVEIDADSLFPTASMVKVPILLGIMDKLHSKQLDYHQDLIYTDSLFYSKGDILGSFKSGSAISLAKLIMLMLTTSDNTASLWLQSLAGGGTRINALLDSLGYVHTRVNSRTPGREADRSKMGWGQTTPREMAGILERIWKRELISDSLSGKMLRLLGRNYWDEQALSSVPPGVFVASKNGAVDSSRSEVFLVLGRHPYLCCICTKQNSDTGWGPDNEAWMLAKALSALCWKYYE